MISVDYDLAPQDVWPELIDSIDHGQKLFLCSRIIYLSFDEGLTCIVTRLNRMFADYTQFSVKTKS